LRGIDPTHHLRNGDAREASVMQRAIERAGEFRRQELDALAQMIAQRVVDGLGRALKAKK
jgi:hypothetical protein